MINYFYKMSKLIQLVVIFIMLFSYAMFQGGFVSWFLFYASLPVLGYLLLVVLYPMTDFHVSRTLSDPLTHAGSTVTVVIKLTRKLPLPLPFIIIEDEMPASLQARYSDKDSIKALDYPQLLKFKRVKKQAHYPIFSRTITYSYQLSELPRGEHSLRTVHLETSDFFGFVKKRRSFSEETDLVVTPVPFEVKDVRLTEPEADGTTSRSFNFNQRTNVVTSVREYLPGDRFSWIDWKTSARKDKLMTKEFEREQHAHVLIILDATRQALQNEAAFELNIRVITGLINFWEKEGLHIGLLGLSQQNNYYPPDLKQRKLRNKYLAKVQVDHRCLFEESLQTDLAKLNPSTQVMFFVTDIAQEALFSFKKIKAGNKRVLVFLTKSDQSLTDQNKKLIKELSFIGIKVIVLDEAIFKQARLAMTI